MGYAGTLFYSVLKSIRLKSQSLMTLLHTLQYEYTTTRNRIGQELPCNVQKIFIKTLNVMMKDASLYCTKQVS